MPSVGGASSGARSSASRASSSSRSSAKSSAAKSTKSSAKSSSTSSTKSTSKTPSTTPKAKTPASSKTVQANRTRAAGLEADAKSKAIARDQAKPKISGPAGELKAGINNGNAKVEGKGHLAKIGTDQRGAKLGTGEASLKVGKDGVDAKAKASLIGVDSTNPKTGDRIQADIGKVEGQFKVDKDGIAIKGDARTIEGTYTNGKGDVKVDAKGPGVTAGLELNPDKKPGEKGKVFRAKVGADLGEVEGTVGKNDPTKGDDTQYHGGLRAGLKGGAEFDVTDKDGDGRPEYTAKVDLGPISFGVTQEGRNLGDAIRNFFGF